MRNFRIRAFVSYVIFLLTGLSIQVSAQLNDAPLPFFQMDGNTAVQTEQMNSLADTIAIVNHRADDIVWSRVVYRIIDLREKQNNQLFYPVIPNERYKNLFRLILDANVLGELRAYEKKEFDITPNYLKPIAKDKLPEYYQICDWDSVNAKIRKTPLLEPDEKTSKLGVSSYAYPDYASKMSKYLIQEIVFFNKHYSRMYTKIIGIAPIYIYNETNVTNMNLLGLNKGGEGIWNFFQSSVVCWYLFDELRPYLVTQYMLPNGNETERLSFDEYFMQKMFDSYLLGDVNMYNRTFLQTFNDKKNVRKEQLRVEGELLNTEMDLWEY